MGIITFLTELAVNIVFWPVVWVDKLRRMRTVETLHATSLRRRYRNITYTRPYKIFLGEKSVKGERVAFSQMSSSPTVYANFVGNGRYTGTGYDMYRAYLNLVQNRERATFIEMRQQVVDLPYEIVE